MEEILNKINKILEDKKDYLYVKEEIIVVYFMIGKYLDKKNYNAVYQVEDILRKKYGLLIGFSRRNLNNIIKFYSIYKNYDINIIKKISWNLHLIIMKQKNKDELLEYCLKYNLTKNDLNKIIKKGFDTKYISHNVEKDIVTLEIMNLMLSNINKF